MSYSNKFYSSQAPPTLHLEVYCWSLGGIRGGRSGVNDTASPGRGAAADPPPVEGSPPDVSMTTFGVMYSLAAWRRPPSPLPKSAARPPWALPAALNRATIGSWLSLFRQRWSRGALGLDMEGHRDIGQMLLRTRHQKQAIDGVVLNTPARKNAGDPRFLGQDARDNLFR